MKRIYVFLSVIFVCLFMCSCTSNKKVDLWTLLEFENKDDVINCLGEPSSTESYEHYDVIFMDNNFSMLADYDNQILESISLTYYLVGMQDVELAIDMLEYEPTTDDVAKAELLMDEILNEFTEEFGEPDVYNSPVNTTTYSWTLNDCEIELQDNIDNQDLILVGPIDINIEY